MRSRTVINKHVYTQSCLFAQGSHIGNFETNLSYVIRVLEMKKPCTALLFFMVIYHAFYLIVFVVAWVRVSVVD